MCTVSLFGDAARLLVTMNRDESLLRGPESPPRKHGRGASAWLGPSDQESGGTWIGANAHGVAACLLNRYEEGEEGPSKALSRGGIIPALLARGPLDYCLDWLFGAFRPEPYSSFTLIVMGAAGGATAAWDSRGSLRRGEVPPGWWATTSSSWNREAVVDWRMEKFREWAALGAPPFQRGIPAFNLLHEAGKERWSPLVRRERVETRSITQVEIDRVAGWLEIRYWPRPLLDLDRQERLSVSLRGAFSTAG